MITSPLGRLLAGLTALVLGAGSAVATVVLHQAWPWLVLSLAVAATAVWVLAVRWLRVAYAGPWAGIVLLSAAPRGEGDYLVPSDTTGWMLLGGAVVLLLAALVLPDHEAAADVTSHPEEAANPGSDGPST